MKQVDRETIIKMELMQLELEQESNQRAIRKLAEAEYEYSEIQSSEQHFYQELLEANQGAEKQYFFADLEAESRDLQQKQQQRLQERQDELLAQKKALISQEDRLYMERRKLLEPEVGADK
ncbi:hypothetical protein GIX45_06785 [Erwinia sp. CPCC 100877]|nr:hypothetical protein [Erwinia sp. CPCC 100877]